ncbi:phosphotransferase [Bacillus sp. RO2]|uniref:phosphotransferase n=1 Tax=Bacillus sp. RO2 TaxID=2723913 RepID=UPI00145CEB45|nr:phosphotransferase [Bacillus sp. RO2]NMH75301.1 phosphotransferase [Bacillus sp. RO2]
MKKKYKYILVENGIYINDRVNLVTLFFLLYYRTKSFFYFSRLSKSKWFNILPLPIIRAIRVMHFFLKRNTTPIRIIESDIYGHCLLTLRQGEYKVFNLKKKTVETYFPDISDPAFLGKVSKLIQINDMLIAPKIVDIDSSKKTIKEQYFNYYSLQSLKCKMKQEIKDVLYQLLKYRPPKKVKLQKYIDIKVRKIEEYLLNYESNMNINKIKKFTSSRLLELGKQIDSEELNLHFSHGDLWDGNVLVHGNNFIVIDWNTYGYRSPFFDTFYYVFIEFFKDKKVEKLSVIYANNRMKELIASIIERDDTFFSQRITDENIKHIITKYINIFIIELIYLKLDLENDRKCPNHLEETVTWVVRCEEFLKFCEINKCFERETLFNREAL